MNKTETVWNDTSFNVDELCRILGMSKSQLNRRTKQVTGKTPNNLIKDIRLKRALRMIKKQKGNIAEIAYQTGFNSPAYFSKCFQERFGVLPSNYAKQKKEFLYQ
jgi:AraC-like DNA-binding protein